MKLCKINIPVLQAEYRCTAGFGCLLRGELNHGHLTGGYVATVGSGKADDRGLQQ